jgi:hypothetical protein
VSDWTIDDEEMRGHILDILRAKLAEFARHASAADFSANVRVRAEDRELASACAAWNRRSAQHYQHAIDLLAAAPMPAKEEA